MIESIASDQNFHDSTFSLEKEVKKCGHICYPSTTLNCCTCMDTRPILSGNCYPCYQDGEGWTNTAARDAGYCPVCNPKNFAAWEERIRKTREDKNNNLARLAIEQEALQAIADEDKARAAAIAKQDSLTKFEYSNGDVYEGDLLLGERHGSGKMIYADGSVYEGEWKHDMYDGKGMKDWCDGITYVGEWKNGMMEGKGVYTMAHGTVLEGVFKEDEFVE